MTLVKGMPVAAAARLVGEHDTRLWRVIQHYVETAVARMDLSDLRRVAIDATAANAVNFPHPAVRDEVRFQLEVCKDP